MRAIHLLFVPALLSACAAPTGLAAGPELAIPVFAADDPRVGQAGFVGETLRLHREEDGTRYTLMAFRVGEAWTLGAMVRGDAGFAGEVQWSIGERELVIPFDTAAPAATTQVRVTPPTEDEPTPEAAGFRGTVWVNVDLPAAWIQRGTPVQLRFAARDGAAIALPDAGVAYTVVPTDASTP